MNARQLAIERRRIMRRECPVCMASKGMPCIGVPRGLLHESRKLQWELLEAQLAAAVNQEGEE